MACEAMTRALGAPVAEWTSGELQVARWRHGDAFLEWADEDSTCLIMSLSKGQHVTGHFGCNRRQEHARPGLITVPANDEVTAFTVRGPADILCIMLKGRPARSVRPLFLSETPVIARCGMQALALLTAGEDDPLAAAEICLALRPALYGPVKAPRSYGGLSPGQLRRVLELIDEAITQERTISLNELAGAARVSLFHFAHEFSRSVGISPYAYSLQRRVDRASRLLLETRETVSEVGFRCGFASPAHFVHRFHKTIGVPPGRYRDLLSS